MGAMIVKWTVLFGLAVIAALELAFMIWDDRRDK